VRGGETKLRLGDALLYVSVYNLFTSLPPAPGIFGGKRDITSLKSKGRLGALFLFAGVVLLLLVFLGRGFFARRLFSSAFSSQAPSWQGLSSPP